MNRTASRRTPIGPAGLALLLLLGLACGSTLAQQGDEYEPIGSDSCADCHEESDHDTFIAIHSHDHPTTHHNLTKHDHHYAADDDIGSDNDCSNTPSGPRGGGVRFRFRNDSAYRRRCRSGRESRRSLGPCRIRRSHTNHRGAEVLGSVHDRQPRLARNCHERRPLG